MFDFFLGFVNGDFEKWRTKSFLMSNRPRSWEYPKNNNNKHSKDQQIPAKHREKSTTTRNVFFCNWMPNRLIIVQVRIILNSFMELSRIVEWIVAKFQIKPVKHGNLDLLVRIVQKNKEKTNPIYLTKTIQLTIPRVNRKHCVWSNSLNGGVEWPMVTGQV